MNPIDSSSVLELEDVLRVVRETGDISSFEVIYAVYSAEEPSLTVSEIAERIDVSEQEVRSRIESMRGAGVIDTRMACLIGEDCNGEQYEVTEFGRVLFEDGIQALFDVANGTATS